MPVCLDAFLETANELPPPRLRLPAPLLVAACATQPKPLQGDFTPLTPRDAADRDSTGAVGALGRPHRADRAAGQNRTCFEMISTPLDVYGRPYWADDDTGGRFIACRAGFYDPAVFEKSREVTFTGRVDGYENRRIGEYDYRFPRVSRRCRSTCGRMRERVNVVTTTRRPWPWWGWW